MTSRDTMTDATPALPALANIGQIGAIFANQEQWLVRLATGSASTSTSAPTPHARIWNDEHVRAARTGRAGVMLLSSSGDLPVTPQAIDRALTWLSTTGCGDVLMWSARPHSYLDRCLLARGARDSFAPHWMRRDLRRPVPAVFPPSRIDLTLATADDLHDLLGSHGVPYIEEDQIRKMVRLASTPLAARRVWVILARETAVLRRSRIVGMTAVNLTEHGNTRLAGMYNLGVHPDARYRGIGTALTLHALSLAREQGAIAMGLNATPDGERVYRKLGFRSLGVGQTWFMPAARLRHRPDPQIVAQAEALARGELAGLDPAIAMGGPMPNGESPVVFAARFAQADSVRWLLEHGAMPDIIPLWKLGFRDDATRLMGDARLLNRIAGQRQTAPLHDAIELGDTELARHLIAAGADLTMRDSQYHGTPLDWARALNRPAIEALLIDARR